MSTASVIAPYVDTLVKIMGDSLGSPTHDIWMQGITFAHSTYLRASDSGLLVSQAGMYNLPTTNAQYGYGGRPEAAVYIACAHNIRIERNIFTQLAATGLDFNYGTHDDIVIGNMFYDIGGSGISDAKFFQDGNTWDSQPYKPVDNREICVNDSIINNNISNVATEIYGACGIACGYPQSIRIEHNEVSYCNYTGISVGWGWTTASTALNNNYINFNNVHHIAQILCDAGAIYVLSKQPNSQIQNNYVHDFQKSQWADYGIASIFIDEETSGYTISNNVLINVPSMEYNGSYNDNVSINNNGQDSSVITAAGIESPYTSNSIMVPLILKEQRAIQTSTQSSNKSINNSGHILNIEGRLVKINQHENPVDIIVTNASGRTILQKSLSGVSMVDLKSLGLAKGVYFLSVYLTEQKPDVQKVNVLW